MGLPSEQFLAVFRTETEEMELSSGGIEEKFFAIVTPLGIEAAGSGDLILAGAVGEMNDGDFAVAGKPGFVSNPLAIGRKSSAAGALFVGRAIEMVCSRQRAKPTRCC